MTVGEILQNALELLESLGYSRGDIHDDLQRLLDRDLSVDVLNQTVEPKDTRYAPGPDALQQLPIELPIEGRDAIQRHKDRLLQQSKDWQREISKPWR